MRVSYEKAMAAPAKLKLGILNKERPDFWNRVVLYLKLAIQFVEMNGAKKRMRKKVVDIADMVIMHVTSSRTLYMNRDLRRPLNLMIRAKEAYEWRGAAVGKLLEALQILHDSLSMVDGVEPPSDEEVDQLISSVSVSSTDAEKIRIISTI